MIIKIMEHLIKYYFSCKRKYLSQFIRIFWVKCEDIFTLEMDAKISNIDNILKVEEQIKKNVDRNWNFDQFDNI